MEIIVKKGGIDMDRRNEKVDCSQLKDINKIKIDSNLPCHEKIESFIEQIGNPYRYLDNGIVVEISFTDTQETLQDRLKSYASTLG